MIVSPPGPMSRVLAAKLAAVECPAFDARRGARADASGTDQSPIVFASARGANVIDADGNRYVDLAAGFGALLLGHAAKRVARAIEAQGDRLWLALGDVYAADVKVALCERLSKLFPEPGARVMLGITGADAVTAALKTAVLATGRAGVVAFQGSYHGLSYGPLAACGLSEAFRAPFAAQLGDHVEFLPYPTNDAQLETCRMELGAVLERGGIGCVLVEPILGRGGCVVPPAGFLAMLRDACDSSGALLVADEIWTGLGRSGAMLASVDAGAVPDLICLGKGLGGGIPISACVGRAKAFAGWVARGGSAIHTATHFGSPIACAAAIATLDGIASERLWVRAREVGERWIDALVEQTRGRGVVAVRGRGLMVGVELEGGAARALDVTRSLLGRGYIVLTGGVRGDVLTLTPPLTIDEPLLGGFASTLGECLT
jgi:4-aminobutyrate aminotransferase / (S)-3-amino-2-methylpropionate transaminase / 5-aminovalerate transaminase